MLQVPQMAASPVANFINAAPSNVSLARRYALAIICHIL